MIQQLCLSTIFLCGMGLGYLIGFAQERRKG